MSSKYDLILSFGRSELDDYSICKHSTNAPGFCSFSGASVQPDEQRAAGKANIAPHCSLLLAVGSSGHVMVWYLIRLKISIVHKYTRKQD